jgi:hypothetical protein
MTQWTWVGWLNFVLIQWSCFRLARIVDTDDGHHIGWTWIGPVMPLTGWWNKYWYICRKIP